MQEAPGQTLSAAMLASKAQDLSGRLVGSSLDPTLRALLGELFLFDTQRVEARELIAQLVACVQRLEAENARLRAALPPQVVGGD